MKLQKDVEILQPEASKTVIKWYPSAAYSQSIAYPFFSFGTVMPLMGGFMATAPHCPFQAEILAISGAVFALSNGFGYILGKASHANYSMQASNMGIKDIVRAARRKTQRKLVEEYYIRHPDPFRGLVTKEQQSSQLIATHIVKSYVVSGKGKTYIEQEITETQRHRWDNAMDSIESLMTVSTQKNKPFTMLGK